MCKMYFTPEYKSRLFISLHNTQEFSVVQRIDFSLNDGSSDIINLIDTSYVKTEDTTIMDMLQSMLEVIYIIS